MLDSDLAELYGVETRIINQAVKRNSERFPLDLFFVLNSQEIQNLRSQFVISSWGGRSTYERSRYVTDQFKLDVKKFEAQLAEIVKIA